LSVSDHLNLCCMEYGLGQILDDTANELPSCYFCSNSLMKLCTISFSILLNLVTKFLGLHVLSISESIRSCCSPTFLCFVLWTSELWHCVVFWYIVTSVWYGNYCLRYEVELMPLFNFTFDAQTRMYGLTSCDLYASTDIGTTL
jgi:hypothetical protein